MKITNIHDPKVPLTLAIILAISGAFQLWTYWNSFAEWIRICSLSYDEVKQTPFVPIWTSLRGAAAFLPLTGALYLFGKYLQRRKAAKTGEGPAGTAHEPALVSGP